jgi:hypothetical protein
MVRAAVGVTNWSVVWNDPPSSRLMSPPTSSTLSLVSSQVKISRAAEAAIVVELDLRVSAAWCRGRATAAFTYAIQADG